MVCLRCSMFFISWIARSVTFLDVIANFLVRLLIRGPACADTADSTAAAECRRRSAGSGNLRRLSKCRRPAPPAARPDPSSASPGRGSRCRITSTAIWICSSGRRSTFASSLNCRSLHQLQMIGDDLPRHAALAVAALDLQQQAFAHIGGSHAGRIQRVNHAQTLPPVSGDSCPSGSRDLFRTSDVR